MKSQIYLFSNRSDLLVPVSLSLELLKGPFDWFPSPGFSKQNLLLLSSAFSPRAHPNPHLQLCNR